MSDRLDHLIVWALNGLAPSARFERDLLSQLRARRDLPTLDVVAEDSYGDQHGDHRPWLVVGGATAGAVGAGFALYGIRRLHQRKGAA